MRELRIKGRRQDGRTDDPSAAIIDSQSVKGADTADRTTRRYDAGKKTNGRKRFIVTDITGLFVTSLVCLSDHPDKARIRRPGIRRTAGGLGP
ncbi:transposase [Spongiactinospora gelatinilytica]|uniref:transposase n=1 Tax=Spongiactinospora gelatinilytica TaxID=2666298 RepID=UPI0011B94CB4|nr:transposase [Spongiactinospora gelatinilytica]